jgi:hypothetical protein
VRITMESREKMELLALRWMLGQKLSEDEMTMLIMVLVVETQGRPGSIAFGARLREKTALATAGDLIHA